MKWKNIKLYLNNLISCTIFSFCFISFATITTSCSQSVPKEENKQTIEEESPIKHADEFFPKINVNDYYDLLKFDKHLPIITNELKIQLIKDVINRVASSKGQIYFHITEKNPQEAIFKFKWVYKKTVLYKTYTLNFVN